MWQNSRVVKLLLFEILRNKVRRGKYGKIYNKTVAAADPGPDRDHISFFAMMRLAGGDAVTYMYENTGSAVSQEVIDKAKAEYGLDKPFLVQYAAWFAGMVTGDMG